MATKLFAAVVCVALALSFSSAGSAQIKADGAFFAIVVRDADASIRWYQSNLGLHLLKRSMSPRGDAGAAVLESPGLYVELIYFVNPAAPSAQKSNAPLPPGLVKAGAVLTPSAFDALFRHLTANGVKFRGGIVTDRDMKKRSFIAEDNEGNLVQFFAPTSK